MAWRRERDGRGFLLEPLRISNDRLGGRVDVEERLRSGDAERLILLEGRRR